MAIKIPSKNIYNIKNPKIRDNFIDNIKVEQKNIIENSEYDIVVFRKEIENDLTLVPLENFDYVQNASKYEYVTLHDGSIVNGYDIRFISCCGYQDYKRTEKITIKIPKLSKNKYITNVFAGETEQNEEQIKYALYGKIATGNAKVTTTIKTEKQSVEFTNVKILTQNISKTSSMVIPKSISYTYEGTHQISGKTATVTSSLSYDAFSKIFEKEFDEDEDYFYLSFYIIPSLRIIKVGFNYANPTSYDIITSDGAIYEDYIPVRIEFSIYGNTIGIDLEDDTLSYKSGNNPFSLNGNELMQDKMVVAYPFPQANEATIRITGSTSFGDFYQSYFEVVSGDLQVNDYININEEICLNEGGYFNTATYLSTGEITIPYYKYQEYENWKNPRTASENLANNIVDKYIKGRETAVVLCDISDYFNEDGSKAIDIATENMFFKLHDEVIPYVYGVKGNDYPMSKKQDGTAKVFEVVGTNIFFDGAVWQELTLLEKT